MSSPETAFKAEAAGQRLNEILAEAGQPELDPVVAARFGGYLDLLLRWNARTNLTAIRDAEGILRRHFVESIVCARAIPAGTRMLLDFGSGAGFPGIPIALCRAEIAVTLAESQGKKAAFLHEAARVLGLDIEVHGARAETLGRTFDCVTLRAVDRMGEAVRSAARLVSPHGWMVLMTTGREAEEMGGAAGAGWAWGDALRLPGGEDRILLAGHRVG